MEDFGTYGFGSCSADLPDSSNGETDVMYHTNLWANFFKAQTWEKVRMFANKDSDIKEAAEERKLRVEAQKLAAEQKKRADAEIAELKRQLSEYRK